MFLPALYPNSSHKTCGKNWEEFLANKTRTWIHCNVLFSAYKPLVMYGLVGESGSWMLSGKTLCPSLLFDLRGWLPPGCFVRWLIFVVVVVVRHVHFTVNSVNHTARFAGIQPDCDIYSGFILLVIEQKPTYRKHKVKVGASCAENVSALFSITAWQVDLLLQNLVTSAFTFKCFKWEV